MSVQSRIPGSLSQKIIDSGVSSGRTDAAKRTGTSEGLKHKGTDERRNVSAIDVLIRFNRPGR